MNQKLFTLVLACLLLSSQVTANTALASSPAVDYLCSLGISFYEKGRYEEALREFQKVLVVNPDNTLAKKYINTIILKQDKAPGSAQKKYPLKVVTASAVTQPEYIAPVVEPTPELHTTTIYPQRKTIPARTLKPAVTTAKLSAPVVQPVVEKNNPQAAYAPLSQDVIQEMQSNPNRDNAMASAFGSLYGTEGAVEETNEVPTAEEKTQSEESKEPGLRITGEVQARIGMTPDDFVWKRANWDLNEKNWRQLSHDGLNNTINTYDSRIYDRLRVNVDAGATADQEGFSFHSNITVDPWSFTGKSEEVTVTGLGGDPAQFQIKYWSNTGYTLNEKVNTLANGDSFYLPEMKLRNGHTVSPIEVRSSWGNTYYIPETKIERTFQPVRELWADYKNENLKLRVYPMAYENQAISFNDPLKLSNNHIWWENSPWLNNWQPGHYNSGPNDFNKGFWDNTLSFYTRDSEGQRLTALRGFFFEFTPQEGTSLVTSVATPKSLWQDYSDADNFLSATRFTQDIQDNLELGISATTRMGYNRDVNNQLDAKNYVVATDLKYEIMDGLMASAEVAFSRSKYDITNDTFETQKRGNAYHLSLIGRYPRESIMDTQYGYDGIQKAEGESSLTKFRLFVSRMDEGFDEPLSNYRETRDDEFWSRHLHFRQPFEHYYQGEGQTLSWDDIKNYSVGNGVDYGRSVIGLRVQTSLWDSSMDNFFDVRNVHENDGKFVENVVRDELTWKITEKLTSKVLGLYNKLPRTHAGTDPFIFNPQTGRYFDNTYIQDGTSPTISTGSAGLNYDFFDWLGLSGIWELTNDISLGYDNFPRGLFNDGNNSVLDYEYNNTYRSVRNWLYNQQYFPKPPYPYYNIFKTGLRITPRENLEFYLDYTRNPYEKAGPIDENMNHVGLLVSYTPIPKLAMFFRYTYSRWQDIDKLLFGDLKLYGHHNFFFESIYHISDDSDFTFQYGEGSRDPYMGGVLDIGWDPYGGDLRTVDTQHIFRLYYRRKF